MADSTNNTTPPVKKKVYKKNFCEHWLNQSIFASWLEKYNGNEYNARCKACNTNFKGGKSELLRHVKTTVHTIQMQRLHISSEAGTKSNKTFYERNSCASRIANCKFKKVIDLRSDALTKPTKKMREAMAMQKLVMMFSQRIQQF